MRIITVGLLMLAAACDPGAAFKLVGGTDAKPVWPVAGDSVRATVRASAFTIELFVEASVDAPADVTLTVESASLVIRDVDSIPLQLQGFSSVCKDSTSVAAGRSRRCASGYVDLQSTNYDRLDSMSVKVGYALAGGRRFPLIVRLARVR
ncbi:MAG TPA: hypothetical protein VJW73_07180 [Gemmatimonadaceae bacterium]|nr:hypothetical protein [Gemmatimonadaceae bacterium]